MAKKKHRFIKFVFTVLILAVVAYFAAPYALRAYYKLDYRDAIQEAAEEYQVNPYWLAAMIKCESNYESDAESSAGAIGLMQLMYDTAVDIAEDGLIDTSKFSVDDLLDPVTNINFGAAYIRMLVERYHEMDPAIAAYNAGLGNVDAWLENDSDVRNSVEFDETEKYLKKVKRAKKMYEWLYPDAFDWE